METDDYMKDYLIESDKIIQPIFDDIKSFCEKEIKKVFPNESTQIITGTTGLQCNGIKINQNGNAFYKNSNYYYPKDSIKLIHYTSLETLITILKDQKFYLSNIKNVNDPQEFLQVFNKSNYFDWKDKDRYINDVLEKIYFASFCEYEDNSKEHFDLWRLYGNDGKGVGIVFEINNINREIWENFHLSYVHYDDDESKNPLIDLLNSYYHNIYKKYESDGIDTLSNGILKCLSFHKNSIWQKEEEVRLLHFVDDLFQKQNDSNIEVKLTNNIVEKKYYSIPIKLNDFEVEISKEQKQSNIYDINRLPSFEPELKISKIIIGYHYSEAEYKKIQSYIFNNVFNKKDYSTSLFHNIKHSELIKYFHK